MPSSNDFDPVAKAEQAMERLSVNFGNWMKEEVFKLQKAWEPMEKGEWTEETVATLFRSAHDIKGQGHTMGFPIAGVIAGSLCDLIETIPQVEDLPKQIMQKHVQAITAVVNEGAREEDNAIGNKLANELSSVAIDHIEKVTGKPFDPNNR
ncbi:Hpt domain-containing protein [Cohaesibacter sp. ES.047]|uniref:Hpt domain-containing protein n=1 Tax=Cohaesibacter sp. ES.047 TaxID=1798205 RepID=UPI0012FD23C1|nr:Hpt domain-containing protein [Cohaesibacter sp. ES.047]